MRCRVPRCPERQPGASVKTFTPHSLPLPAVPLPDQIGFFDSLKVLNISCEILGGACACQPCSPALQPRIAQLRSSPGQWQQPAPGQQELC